MPYLLERIIALKSTIRQKLLQPSRVYQPLSLQIYQFNLFMLEVFWKKYQVCFAQNPNVVISIIRMLSNLHPLSLKIYQLNLFMLEVRQICKKQHGGFAQNPNVTLLTE